ncbi:MAG: ribonuclease J [Clostridiaceae bacterium]|nr:ribonuclease J [Eubacteriales bacterium]MDD4743844.1 ribonuclease J [Eubacteriales bacterium]NLB45955.1 ribonuclease J [Clostridiaceae bacterium]
MPLQPNRRRSRLAPRRKESPDATQPEALANPKASSKSTAAKPPKKTVAAQPAARPAQTASPRRKTRAGKNPAVSRAAKPVAASTTPLLKVIPLGGMREIGKNMTIYEYGDEMIMVDCGIAFPEDDMPGIDVVIPDFSYVMQNKHKLKGIFLTHGHEDHIGALPWLCRDIHVPIYGNQLTIELVRLKLEDRGTGVSRVTLKPVKDSDRIEAGAFSVEFIHVNHSIADANALVVRCPAGTIYHSGDFKVDYTPINGGPMDLSRIAAVGQENVLLLVCESTNVERKGHSSSESKVGETFADLFAKAAGRIFVTTFSSNVFRIQQIFTAAEQQGRKVALIGRSMLNYFNAANSLGYINMNPDTLIDINQIDRYAADQLVLITTGSQGEPMSALTRMAFSEHRRVEIVPGDTVILSSSAIPGNEKSVYRVINELYKRGAAVIYESLSEIHVSGHAYQDELKLLHQLLKPRYFVPGHGEYRHLYRHAELAHQMGMPWDDIFLLNNGDIFEYQDGNARISGFVQAAGVLIDGSSMGEADNLVLRERRLLADDGVMSIFIAVSRADGQLVASPDIQARGFIYEVEADRLIKECQKKIEAFARRSQGKPSLPEMVESGALHDQLRNLLFERTKRRPVILISLIQV